MKVPCDYHPTQMAHFTCGRCEKSFCPECIAQRNFQKNGVPTTAYFCPKCNIPATRLGMGNILPPFWQRIPNFFAYPFRLQPFLFMLALALLGTAFPTSALVKFVSSVLLVKYSYSVLTNTAQGNLGAPKDIVGILTGNVSVVFKQLGIFIILAMAGAWLAAQSGPVVAVAFAGFALLYIPSMFMSLAATNSLLHAVNPMVFVRLPFRIGWSYLLMYLFLLMMAGGPAALYPYLAALLPEAPQIFLFGFAKQYYTIMAYNLMGYVLLQYSGEIGYDVDYEAVIEQHQQPFQNKAKKKAASREGKILSEVNRLIKEGRADYAIELIHNETQDEISSPDLGQRYYNLLKLGRRTPQLLAYCKNYIGLLMQSTKFTEAFKIYNECLAHDPNFTPNPTGFYKIAEWLARSGDAKRALNTAVKFVKTNPTHRLTPEAYFLVAKILHERLNSGAKAREILQTILKNYPEHELADKVRYYLQRLGGVQPAQ